MPRSLLKFDIKSLLILIIFCVMTFVDINLEIINLVKRNLVDTGLRGNAPSSITVERNRLTYYNVNSKLKWKNTDGIAIVMLVSSLQENVDDACTALRSLSFLGGDDLDYPAHVLIFNEGDLSQNQTDAIKSSTDRTIAFPAVDLKTFPEGFDGLSITEQQQHRISQINRFWITGIWKHQALAPYELIMRIDADSCFTARNNYLPQFLYSDMVYHSQYDGVEMNKPIGLFDFARSWMESNGRVAGDPFIWDFIKSTNDKHQSLPVFRTNFELISKSFMQGKWVSAWHEALTEKEPFGVFKSHWSDAAERFLTLSMFTTNDKIATKGIMGYGHGAACPKNYIEQELTRYNARNWILAPMDSKQ